MTINAAKPQDTYDHIIGAGHIGAYSWWLGAKSLTHKGSDIDVPAHWTVEVTCETGEGGSKTVLVDHKAVMRAANRVVNNRYDAASEKLVRECRHLVFNADDADLDAPMADELLQLIVLGEIVFG